jgi:D-arabinose 1-dehydrogenase
MTKCGRYGPSSFDYSPTRIRASIESSMGRLKTTYLDTVYLHDVEFVCTPVVVPRSEEEKKKDASGQAVVPAGQEGKICGEGDQIVLDAIIELRRLQDEGLVRNVGISGKDTLHVRSYTFSLKYGTGYPLPTLLRLALLVLHTPPFKPLDVVLSYCHLTLQNTTLEDYIPHFRHRAQVKQLVAASPLSMGLFAPSPPPPWHPAPKELQKVISGDRWAGRLPDLALGYSMRKARETELPLAVGFSNTSEVHECMKVWTEVCESVDGENRTKSEENVKARIREAGFLNWSWASPQKAS